MSLQTDPRLMRFGRQKRRVPSDERILDALERATIRRIIAHIPTVRRWWRRQIEQAAVDDILIHPVRLRIPELVLDDWQQILQDGKLWGAAAGYWQSQLRLRKKPTRRARFDARHDRRKEEAGKLPGTMTVNQSVQYVKREAANIIPTDASEWFRTYDWDKNGMWGAGLQAKATEMLASEWEAGYTVKQAMGKLGALLSDVESTGVARGAWLENVVRTNMTSMAQAGRYLAYSGDNEIVGYRWDAVNDDRACPICSPLDGQVFERAAVEGGGIAPPMHYSCRCILTPMYASDKPAVTSGTEAREGIRSYMEDLEASGEKGELGAATADSAYRNFERLQDAGFGGKSVWEDLQQAGLV